MSTSAPDLLEPVVGFREWLIVRGCLTSPYIPFRWEERTVRARCFPANRNLQFGRGWVDEPHAAPHARCKCGIYALHRPRSATPFPDADRVWGVVSAWGRIEVHSDGIRAEHARVEALSLEGGERRRDESALRRIAAWLGVELVERDDLPAVAAHCGSPLPDEVIAGASTRLPGAA
ncbi:MAG TPA: hypothetical protein VK387_09535 [Thermoleophilaceae bacterium]|nr:hypothetical protein [Thermoleophilaceae bacterium]